ncbi:hypothetical protein [Nocardia niigatensis]|uniref:hypothetical protein n=1 Tax=Nocardia niigatensis TaxID=209249 RepID=UPI0012F66A14|nr:hypothetical protein [Nocardia niigatensis]
MPDRSRSRIVVTSIVWSSIRRRGRIHHRPARHARRGTERPCAAGKTAEGDLTYAVLLWITSFDERVVYDLTEHRRWSAGQVTGHLTRAVAGALGISV